MDSDLKRKSESTHHSPTSSRVIKIPKTPNPEPATPPPYTTHLLTGRIGRSVGSPIKMIKPLTNVEKEALEIRKSSYNNTQSTPQKGSGNLRYPQEGKRTRDKSEVLRQDHLLGRKLESQDLVEQTFGGFVPLPLATLLLMAFLRLGLVNLTIDETQSTPSPEQMVEGCVEAFVTSYNIFSGTSTTSDASIRNWKPTNKFLWTLAPKLNPGSEENTSMLLNIIATMAHLVAVHVVHAPELDNKKQIRTLWTTLINSNVKFPGPSGQDCRPDIVAVPKAAFIHNIPRQNSTSTGLEASSTSIKPKGKTRTESKESESKEPNHAKSNLDTKPESRPSIQDIIETILKASAETTSSNRDTEASNPTPNDSTDPIPIPKADQIDTLKADLFRLYDQIGSQSPVIQTSFLPTYYDYTKSNAIDERYIRWETFSATGETKMQEHGGAPKVQELGYMQQHRHAQPYLRFVLGLLASKDKMTLLRADSMGTEQQTFLFTTGSGMLELIRVALGFGIADENLGHLPGFEMEKVGFDGETQTLDSDRIGVHGSDRIGFEHGFFIPRYYQTPKDPGNSKSYRFYLHHLAEDTGHLIGQITRVWCAYREIDSNEDINDLVHADDQDAARRSLNNSKETPMFVGPYALKVQNIDPSSTAYKNELMKMIKTAQDTLNQTEGTNSVVKDTGADCVLLPEHIYQGDSILETRGFTTPEAIPEEMTNLPQRQEIITISLFKRRLSQYNSFKEVGCAITDGYRAVNWLHSIGILHRDIHDGNLLLYQEDPTLFKAPFSPDDSPNIVLYRRIPSSLKGIYGILHDLDRCGLVGNMPISNYESDVKKSLSETKIPESEAATSPLREITDTWYSSLTELSDSDEESTPAGITGSSLANGQDGETSTSESGSDKSDNDPTWIEETSGKEEYLECDPGNYPMGGGRTGTPAFMSSLALCTIGARHCRHTVADDMESLFYVLYLFPFSNTAPLRQSYPHAVPDTSNAPKWHRTIKDWTTGDIHTSLQQLSNNKISFFTTSMSYNAPGLTNNSHFENNWNKRSTERRLWEDLVNILHDDYLFYLIPGTDTWYVRGAQQIEASLPKLIEALDMRIRKSSQRLRK